MVIGTGLDRCLPDNSLYSQEDLIYLKKAFYERCKEGFQCTNGGTPYFHDWLDNLIGELTGKSCNGHFNRHYIFNIHAVLLKSGKAHRRQDFTDEYYNGIVRSYEEVIQDADRLAYSLIYGNDNIAVVPSQTIEKEFESTITNNISQKMFAGNKTIVFFKTHGDSRQRDSFEVNFGSALNAFDMCFVMEAKFYLKHLQKMMQGNHPFKTRRVLAAISGYMNVNPFHLAEIKKRTDYLYEALGVNSLFQTVRQQGELHSEADTALLTHKLNIKIGLLTLLMAILAALQLIVSILCCNNSNKPNISTSMCNCMFSGIDSPTGCCAVVCCLLFIVLVASIIVSAIYQVMSYYRLK